MAKVDGQGVAAIKRAGMIAAARVLLPRARSGGRWGGPGMVTVAGGRIAAVTDAPPGEVSGTLTPGLIDLHNNGAFGVDFATGDAGDWRRALAALARRGVTAVQPTVITAPVPVLGAVLRRAAAIRDAIIGSMTMKERRAPEIIKASRKKRIAAGSGTSVQEINKLLKQFDDMSVMMKRMGKLGQKGLMRQGIGALMPKGMGQQRPRGY